MPTPAEPLAEVLDRDWEDQGRIGFLLPASEEVEIRSVEDPVSAVSFRFRWLPHRELRSDLAELEARGIVSADRGDTELFRPLTENLIHSDPFMVLADFQSYVDCQDRVGETWRDQDRWTRMSILNVARMGKFSSDRSIRDYCDDIWKVEPVRVK